jgi:hypothetical protein
VALLKRRPAFQLSGLAISTDGLYDGSFITACARWWNHEIESNGKLQAAGYRPFDEHDVRRLCEIPQPENRAILERVAWEHAGRARQSAPTLCLSYAFAVVVEAAAHQVLDDFPDAAWERVRPLTDADVTELARHYSAEGNALSFETWMPYWKFAQTILADKVAAKTVRSVKATFDDQVDRWSAAEGFDLRNTLAEPDYSMIAAEVENENAGFGLPNCVELLFEWGGRLRHGERIIADGWDMRSMRFSHDEFDVLEHLYKEAFERYAPLAEQENPVSGEIERAIVIGAAWLGDSADVERPVVATTAIRGYLWRTVEGRAGGFLEPELSEAVADCRRRPEPR